MQTVVLLLTRKTDSSGNVTSYIGLQWNESSGYWRSWDGSVEQRFVTGGETQILTNKTLTAPTLTAPVLVQQRNIYLMVLGIASTASATLDIATSKTLDVEEISFLLLTMLLLLSVLTSDRVVMLHTQRTL
ncbi:MAG: hypothetical protein CM15mV3_2000 [Caudoviricetes sp.]|nr:MAG: hypothetical protein CM15mV3_2000 [Caudoviricetes sp.]